MEQEVKRGRGRPKKVLTLQETRELEAKKLEGKRRRGRPTKEEQINHQALVKTAEKLVYKNKAHEGSYNFRHPEVPETKIAKYNALNKHVLTLGRKRMNWQAENVDEEIFNRYDSMLEKCIELDIEPNETLFACALGITRETLYHYMGRNFPQHKSEKVMDALELCVTTLVASLESKTLSNDVNVVGGIFVLKNSRLGFKDQTDVVVQGNVENEKSAKELLAGADLLPDDTTIIDVEAVEEKK